VRAQLADIPGCGDAADAVADDDDVHEMKVLIEKRPKEKQKKRVLMDIFVRA
jgi:hypothetical protein